MKLKLSSILKGVIVAAAPVVATAVAGPGAGVLVTGALGGGAAGREIGVRIEGVTKKPAQKVLGPLGAALIPLLLAQILSPEVLAQVCEVMATACQNPEKLAGLSAAAVAVLAHTMGDGTQKAMDGREPKP